MKTTNFKISKELAEIGFVPSYDLQTLINVLPDKITTKFEDYDTGEIWECEETLTIYKSGIGYFYKGDNIDYYRTNYGYYSKFSLVVEYWKGESLADTAGRLLIKLHKVGIINFKKMENGK